MVSNSMDMDLEELLAALRKIKREHGKTEEYRAWRKELPDDWPI